MKSVLYRYDGIESFWLKLVLSRAIASYCLCCRCSDFTSRLVFSGWVCYFYPADSGLRSRSCPGFTRGKYASGVSTLDQADFYHLRKGCQYGSQARSWAIVVARISESSRVKLAKLWRKSCWHRCSILRSMRLETMLFLVVLNGRAGFADVVAMM